VKKKKNMHCTSPRSKDASNLTKILGHWQGALKA